jgi:hypothetical protein
MRLAHNPLPKERKRRGGLRLKWKAAARLMPAAVLMYLLIEGLIAFSVIERKPAKPARRVYLDLKLMPLCLARSICWIKPYRVLVAQLKRYSRAYFY